MPALFVTAFKDIGRGHAQHAFAKEAHNHYLEPFQRLASLGIPLVCFADDHTYSWIKETTMLPHNALFVYDECSMPSASYVSIERSIMASEEYKQRLRHRLHHPEHSNAESNVVKHDKVMLLKRAKEHFPNFDHYVWIDFLMARILPNLDILKKEIAMPIDCVTMMSLVPLPIQMPHDFFDITVESKDVLQTSIFVVGRPAMDALVNVYSTTLLSMYHRNQVDGDRTVHLIAYHTNPSLYHLVHCNHEGNWPERLFIGVPPPH